MEISNARLQYTKNKRRLISQNIKLMGQVQRIKEQIDHFYYEESLKDVSLADSVIRPILDQISIQQKVIRKLKHQIEMYKLERAKDNVEYIVREEDELKLMRRKQLKLMDQKEILQSRNADKKEQLTKDLPYQNYEKGFLQKLNQVVHFNRDQASKITQIQRQIRKLHLIKKGKDSTVDKILDPNQVVHIEHQINEKVQGKKSMELQWKPHFQQLDQEFAHLLHQASKKKQYLAELQRQEKNWQTRVSGITDADVVLKNKSRIGSVKVSTKLRQKITDYIKNEQEKHVKKVSEEELRLQFAQQQNIDGDKKKKEEEKKAEAKPKSTMPPPLPGQKKKDDKVIQTLHNDKNITKKVEKQNKNAKTNVVIAKTAQQSNTDVSIPPKKSKKTPKSELSPRLSKKASLVLEEQEEEQQQLRVWEPSKQQQQQSPNPSIKSTPKNTSNPKTGVVQMKQVGMTTPFQNWEQT